MRMAFGADRDITHGRIGANSTDPRNGEDVKVRFMGTARDQDGRERVEKSTGFPV
jgi:hypothetical protein